MEKCHLWLAGLRRQENSKRNRLCLSWHGPCKPSAAGSLLALLLAWGCCPRQAEANTEFLGKAEVLKETGL